MKIEYMQEFLMLTETMNYSSAAKRLFISQPTLTRHIQAMEAELGFSLVNTSSHGIELTEQGKLAAKTFRKIIKSYQSFLDQSHSDAMQVKGKLTVGLLYYAIDDYCADFLTDFQKKYPKVELVCRSYLPQELVDDLYAGKVDVATLFYLDKKDFPETTLFPVSRTNLVAVMREDNPLSKLDTVPLDALSEYPLIELKDDEYSNEMTRRSLQLNGVRFDKTLYADNIEMVPLTVRTTGGIHITGESCQRQNASGISYKMIMCRHGQSFFGFCCLEDCNNPLAKVFLESIRASSTTQ